MAVLLKPTYEKIDDVPEAHRELYTEKGGKWELTGVEGVKTTADVDRLSKSLHAAQEDNKKLKAALKAFEPLGKPDEVQAKLDRIEELEALAAAAGGTDEKKIEELVTKRVEGKLRSATTPLERQLKQINDERTALAEELTALKAEKTRRTLHDEIRAAATHKDVNMRVEAIEDAQILGERVFEVTTDGKVLTRDGVPGITPGLKPAEWLRDLQQSRPHWWPETVGGKARGGAGGGGNPGENPWAADTWNMTKQGQFVRQFGMERAGKMAAAAGTTVGGARPAPKK